MAKFVTLQVDDMRIAASVAVEPVSRRWSCCTAGRTRVHSMTA
jgi:hypothetical protein